MKSPFEICSTLLVAGLAACASAAGPEGAPAPDRDVTATTTLQAPSGARAAAGGSTTGAVFSDAQANRGRDTFRAGCTECHFSSEFRDSSFKFKWSRRSAGNLYQMIQTEMPEDAPGSLSPEQTVELVSYILRMNGFEPGASDIMPDRAVLDEISLASIRDE